MKLSINWLKQYVDFKASAQEFAERLTMAGQEVEAIEKIGTDTVFEIEVTPNRADCLNMIGFARETVAIYNTVKKEPVLSKMKFPKQKCPVEIENGEDCARYIGTVVEGVNIKPWDKTKIKFLEAIGSRAISNVVDITNFCLVEQGQPLHAFDYDKLIGGKIIVRRAKKGEKIVTLDDEERELDPSILVIADAERPVAIAGVMGGRDTQVTENTKNILLESAYFDPLLVRRVSRQLGLSTDSSYRFERGVDAQGTERGARRALDLILESAGGTVTQRNDVIAKRLKEKSLSITLNVEDAGAFLATPLTVAKCAGILKKLDFGVTKKSAKVLTVSVPSFRKDVQRSVDLIEEIARVIGYDRIPSSMPLIKAENAGFDSVRQKKEALKNVLVSQGLNEVVTFSLINRKSVEQAKLNRDMVEIVNPLSLDQEIMRPGFLPCMLNVARNNINKGQKNLALFEIGKIYTPQGEKDCLSVLLTGCRVEDWRRFQKDGVDFFDLKGIIECVLSAFRTDGCFEKSGEPFLEIGDQAAVTILGEKAGILGAVTKDVASAFEIKQKGIYFAEILLEPLLTIKQPMKKFTPVCEYPAVVRDISLAVKQSVTYDQVLKIIQEMGSGLLASVEFKEQYLGEKIPDDHRGIIFSLVYQSLDRTLTEDEVNSVHQNICQALIDQLQAVQR